MHIEAVNGRFGLRKMLRIPYDKAQSLLGDTLHVLQLARGSPISLEPTKMRPSASISGC